MHIVMILAMALIGCGDKDGGTDTGATGDGGTTDGGSGDGGTDANFGNYINTTVDPIGDIDSCLDLDTDGDGWVDQSVIAEYQVDAAASGVVEDFESGNGVGAAKVQLWWGNDPTGGAPDYEVESDAEGNLNTTWKLCSPVAYKVSTDPDAGTTVNTYEINQIEPYTEGSTQLTFNSVSATTYAIIPSLLGVSPDGDKGTIAGTASDCGGDPIEGVQVVVTDDAGNIPESLVVKYFVDSFPNRDQPHTSEDGLWVAINIPTGTWNVDMYAYDSGTGDYSLIGRTTAFVFAESIMVSNVYARFEDGKRYPEICTEDVE